MLVTATSIPATLYTGTAYSCAQYISAAIEQRQNINGPEWIPQIM